MSRASGAARSPQEIKGPRARPPMVRPPLRAVEGTFRQTRLRHALDERVVDGSRLVRQELGGASRAALIVLRHRAAVRVAVPRAVGKAHTVCDLRAGVPERAAVRLETCLAGTWVSENGATRSGSVAGASARARAARATASARVAGRPSGARSAVGSRIGSAGARRAVLFCFEGHGRRARVATEVDQGTENGRRRQVDARHQSFLYWFVTRERECSNP